MNVFFTGHRGFLGRELIPELSKEVQIYTFEGNLMDVQEVKAFVKAKAIDRVIHAAARGGRRTKQDSPKILAENFAISMNLRNLELPTLYFCSGAIYGRQNSIYEFSEYRTSETYPNDYYGQSKFLIRECAITDENSLFMRFFNVFGRSEGFDRFVSFNVNQYNVGLPMRVLKNFYMDFFFVKDSIPVIMKWVFGELMPKEINMVYSKKYTLIQVCELINTFDAHSVPIDLISQELGKDYCGDGSTLEKLNSPTIGLTAGLMNIYEHLKNKL